MASTTFVDGETLIEASWLNDVNAAVYIPGTIDAANVSNTPAGNLDATTVQAALNELDAEKQPLSTQLTNIAALAVTDGNIIVGNGTTWVAESGETARTSLGVVEATDTVTGLVRKSTTAENAAGTGTGVVAAADLPVAIAALGLGGSGQAWSPVSRFSGVAVQNTTGSPIVFAMACINPGSGASVTIEVSSDNVAYYKASQNTNGVTTNIAGGSAIVPPGHYYRPTFSGTLVFQSELA